MFGEGGSWNEIRQGISYQVYGVIPPWMVVRQRIPEGIPLTVAEPEPEWTKIEIDPQFSHKAIADLAQILKVKNV